MIETYLQVSGFQAEESLPEIVVKTRGGWAELHIRTFNRWIYVRVKEAREMQDLAVALFRAGNQMLSACGLPNEIKEMAIPLDAGAKEKK